MGSIKAIWSQCSAYLLVAVCVLGFGASATGGCSFIKAPAATPINTGTAVDALDQATKDHIPESGRAALGSIKEAEAAREAAAVGATVGVPGTDRMVLALDRYTEAMRENTAAIVARNQTGNSKEWDTATRDALMQAGWIGLAGWLAGRRKRETA